MATPFDFASGVPPELAAQATALARRRALADALARQALQPAQMPQSGGRMASVMSPLQPITQMLTGVLAGRGQREADVAGQVLGMDYKERQNKAIAQYLIDRKKDPTSAAIAAATSDFDPVRKLGMADFEAMAKGVITPKDYLSVPGATVESRVAAAGGAGAPALRPEPKYQTVADTLVEVPRETGGMPRTVQYYGPEYETNEDGSTRITQVAGADGRPEPYIREKRSGKLVKLDQAPKITQTVGAQRFGNKIPEKLAEKAAGRLDALGSQVSGAETAVASINRLEQLDKEGIFTNRTAAGETFINNISQRLGIKLDYEKLGRTETYSSEVAKLWLAAMESVTGGARGLTEKETEELKKLQPQIQNSPQARQRIYQIYRDGASRLRQQFARALEGVKLAMEADDPGALVQALGQMYTMEAPFGPALSDVSAPTNAPLNVETTQSLPAPTPLAPPKPQGKLRPY